MTVVCPTVTAYDLTSYNQQLDRLKPFVSRLHIDIMDGHFTEKVSISVDSINCPSWIVFDVHLMAESPMSYLDELISLRPNTVIIHSEARVHHMVMAAKLHQAGLRAGLALLQDTPVEQVEQIMHSFDQILIFSGHLGFQGGYADLGLMDKVRKVKALHPQAEIAWDGGVNDQNAAALASAGVNVLNVGSFIQAADNPDEAYAKIVRQLGTNNV